MKPLGTQVKEFRTSKGWNSTQMAEAVRATRMAGTAKASRQNIEGLEAAGNRIPKYLGALAKVMGKSVDEMMALAGLAASSGAERASAEEPVAPYLSDEEEALLSAFGKLDRIGRAIVLRAAGAPFSVDPDERVLADKINSQRAVPPRKRVPGKRGH